MHITKEEVAVSQENSSFSLTYTPPGQESVVLIKECEVVFHTHNTVVSTITVSSPKKDKGPPTTLTRKGVASWEFFW
jgi:hypothetical protein